MAAAKPKRVGVRLRNASPVLRFFLLLLLLCLSFFSFSSSPFFFFFSFSFFCFGFVFLFVCFCCFLFFFLLCGFQSSSSSFHVLRCSCTLHHDLYDHTRCDSAFVWGHVRVVLPTSGLPLLHARKVPAFGWGLGIDRSTRLLLPHCISLEPGLICFRAWVDMRVLTNHGARIGR